MRLKVIGSLAGLALFLVPVGEALAHTDVIVDFGFGLPPPPAVVVESYPRYEYREYRPAPVYYYDSYGYYAPRHYYSHEAWREHEWREHDWHDRGWHDHGRHRG